jgi:hypothetical protein
MAHNRQADALKQTVLTPLEKEVIIGSLLGDGSIMKSGKHFRFRVGHTVRHTEYVVWKYLFLKRLCISEPQVVPTTQSIRFGTVGHPEMTVIRNQWYVSGVKRIPSNFRLTPLMLAIWFMDDGCRQGKSVVFSVHCFSTECVSILRKALAEMQITTTVLFDGKGQRIYVRRSSYNHFKGLVTPYMQLCMAYKLL